MPQKPISARRLAANRANAKKSTGPRTAEGKARSRMNGVKHGLFARHLILPDDTPQSVDELKVMRKRLAADLAGAGILNRLLAETIAASYWRLARAYRFEAAAIARNRDHSRLAAQPGAASGPKPNDHLPEADDLQRLLRYEARIERALHRSLQRLAQLRTPASDPASPLATLKNDLCGPNPPHGPPPHHERTSPSPDPTKTSDSPSTHDTVVN